MAKIRVGLAGCGFVAELHMYAFRRVYGVDVEVKAVAARGDHVVDFARRHNIAVACRSVFASAESSSRKLSTVFRRVWKPSNSSDCCETTCSSVAAAPSGPASCAAISTSAKVW